MSKTIIVKSVSPTFWRGGKQWTREGVELNPDDFTAEQLQAVLKEPELVISDTDAVKTMIDAKLKEEAAKLKEAVAKKTKEDKA